MLRNVLQCTDTTKNSSVVQVSLVWKVKSHILGIELDIHSGFICLYQTVVQKEFEVIWKGMQLNKTGGKWIYVCVKNKTGEKVETEIISQKFYIYIDIDICI